MEELMKRELKIKYTGKLDKKLDLVVEQFAKQIGFKEWARGYSFCDNERDFAFDKWEN
jgi:hypothetical protein